MTTSIDLDDLQYELALADRTDRISLLWELMQQHPEHLDALLGFVVDLEVDDVRQSAFVHGAQMCRELMASFVEHQGLPIIAMSIRANWNPSWGPNPGKPA